MKIQEKLEMARRELLDLGLRNGLINYRPLKSKGVEVVGEMPAQLLQALVYEQKALTFLPAPESKLPPKELLASPIMDQAIDDMPAQTIAPRKATNSLLTIHPATELPKRLLNTYYAARTILEEQGVNLLYLALGMLRWYETPTTPLERRAPLLLIPVQLERKTITDRFYIRWTEGDLEDNPSLRAKLKAEFGMDLPPLPEELDLNAYFGAVEYAVQSAPRWTVDHQAVALGFFSFSTLLMYDDLQDEKWPAHAQPSQHPILQALLQTGFAEPPPALAEDAHLDAHIAPLDLAQVVDADSSQIRAMADIFHGRNLVIQGPPGTGKSQTITNIIAEAIQREKTVLFVAEKMAALEVVKRRLDTIGLGDACLELHSHKSNKKNFLAELRRTLDAGKPKSTDFQQDVQTLLKKQEILNQHSLAMNTPIRQTGLTVYQIYGELLQLQKQLADVTLPALDGQPMMAWSGEKFAHVLDLTQSLQTLLGQIGVPQQHLFWGSQLLVYLPADRRRLKESCQQALAATQQLSQKGEQLASEMGLEMPADRPQALLLTQAAHKALAAPSFVGVQIHAPEWLKQGQEIISALAAGSRLAQLHQQYQSWLIPEAWTQELLPVRQAYQAHAHKWYRFIFKEFRQAQNRLKGLCQKELPKGMVAQKELIEAILEAQRLQPLLKQHQPLLEQLWANHWQGEGSDWDYLQATADWLVLTYQQVENGGMPAQLLPYIATGISPTTLSPYLAQLETALNHHTDTLNHLLQTLQLDETAHLGNGQKVAQLPFAHQQQLVSAWLAQPDALQDIVNYNAITQKFRAANFPQLLPIADSFPLAHLHLVDLLRRTWLEATLDLALSDYPHLATFATATHEHDLHRFCELDQRLFLINRTRLADLHWQRLPRHTANNGQLAILQREFEKKARHLPIRKLMERAGNAIQTIKPIFMMSPFSIASFLPPDTLTFDLIIFDEASQVRPVEALGAILRGKQTIVVGDSQQLPPTSFFDKLGETLTEDDQTESSPTAEIESILGLMRAQGAAQQMLRWHYRSRHESLITLSNAEFYNNQLIVFPSPDAAKKEVGLHFHHLPHTTYDRGKSRTNPQEAQTVAQAVIDHAQNSPHLTLGVASFSVAQTQAIQDELEHLRHQNPHLEPFFAAHPAEPFFVKNLENVQGDERDVIFISVGYGRTADGYLTMNFGPLNQTGGERRLNVLITRARRRCELFSNLTADDIDLNKTTARGLIALKRYLKYAQTGSLDLPAAPHRTADALFDAEVAHALHQHRYTVEHQVGSIGFYLDLAITDPHQPGRYLLGIECDGATYHTARSARDRDRLRQQLLEGLGWKIHRIWATDWFLHPQRELARLLQAIDQAQKQGSTPPLPKPNPAFSVERQTLAPASANLPALPDYQLTLLPTHSSLPLTSLPVIQVADWLVKIVQIESPIHVEEASRRLLQLTPDAKIGNKTKSHIQTALDHATRKKLIHQKGLFLWQPHQPPTPRNRTHLPATSRKLEYIAPEELLLAIELTVKQSLGLQKEAIPQAVCQLLGFSRTPDSAKATFPPLIDQLLHDQRLILQGDFLTIP